MRPNREQSNLLEAFSSEKFVVLGRIYYLCITALTNITTHHEQTDDATGIAAGPAVMGAGDC